MYWDIRLVGAPADVKTKLNDADYMPPAIATAICALIDATATEGFDNVYVRSQGNTEGPGVNSVNFLEVQPVLFMAPPA
jgi:hypothetical protein